MISGRVSDALCIMMQGMHALLLFHQDYKHGTVLYPVGCAFFQFEHDFMSLLWRPADSAEGIQYMNRLPGLVNVGYTRRKALSP